MRERLQTLRITVGYWFFKDHWHKISEKEKQLDAIVNQRVAQTLAQMDPFEPLMRAFGGIFSEEWERSEENLDPRSYYQYVLWAHSQANDQNFKHLMNWVINTQVAATITKGNPTPETILYGRAQISAPILLKREIGRLGFLYEDLLKKQKGESFSSELPVEE